MPSHRPICAASEASTWRLQLHVKFISVHHASLQTAVYEQLRSRLAIVQVAFTLCLMAAGLISSGRINGSPSQVLYEDVNQHPDLKLGGSHHPNAKINRHKPATAPYIALFSMSWYTSYGTRNAIAKSMHPIASSVVSNIHRIIIAQHTSLTNGTPGSRSSVIRIKHDYDRHKLPYHRRILCRPTLSING